MGVNIKSQTINRPTALGISAQTRILPNASLYTTDTEADHKILQMCSSNHHVRSLYYLNESFYHLHLQERVKDKINTHLRIPYVHIFYDFFSLKIYLEDEILNIDLQNVYVFIKKQVYYYNQGS